MVGLVLVGHSAELVGGLARMLAQAAPAVPLEVAGGLPGGRLGTSGPDVAAALRRALERGGADGVLVLLDLGSAGMALDIGLEGLDPGDRSRVIATEAPFVEGAVLAAVAASLGEDLRSVAAAAESATALPKLPGRTR